MKLALIFLSVCFVAISHQQFHQPRPKGLLWWSPYYQSLPVDREDNYPQFSRQLMRRPSRPPPYFYGVRQDYNKKHLTKFTPEFVFWNTFYRIMGISTQT